MKKGFEGEQINSNTFLLHVSFLGGGRGSVPISHKAFSLYSHTDTISNPTGDNNTKNAFHRAVKPSKCDKVGVC